LYEPIPSLFQKCKKRYRSNLNVEVHNLAVSSSAGSLELFEAGLLSTSDTHLLNRYMELDWAAGSVSVNKHQVACTTLREISNTVGSGIDLLIVDVEGHEAEVFLTFGDMKSFPRMIIVELVDQHPDLKDFAVSSSDLSKKIQNFGYSIVFKDIINTIFVKINQDLN
jgi:FkbM family methyltransferase